MFWRCQRTSDGISLLLASLLGVRYWERVSKRHVVCPNMCYHKQNLNLSLQTPDFLFLSRLMTAAGKGLLTMLSEELYT